MSMRDYFNYDPFKTVQNRYAQNMGDRDMPDLIQEGLGLSDAMAEQDPWLAQNWGDPNNVKYERAEGGGYKVTVKSGDKQGTVYLLSPDDKGGFKVAEQGTTKFDTGRYNPFQDPMALAMMAGVGGITAGAMGAFGGAGSAAGGAAPSAGGSSGGLLGGGSSAASTGGGSVIESLLGQSLATPGSMGAAQSAAPGFMAAATQQSLPAIGAFSGLMPEFAAAGPAAFQALADTPLPSSVGGGGGGGSNTPSAPPAKNPTSIAKTIGDALGLSSQAVTALGGLLGAGLGYADAARQNDKKQGENPYWSEQLRKNVNLGGAPGTRPNMSQLQGMVGQRPTMDATNFNQSRQAMSGLLGNVPRSPMQPQENERLRQVFGLLGL